MIYRGVGSKGVRGPWLPQIRLGIEKRTEADINNPLIVEVSREGFKIRKIYG